MLRSFIPVDKEAQPESDKTPGAPVPWYPFGCLSPEYVMTVEKCLSEGCHLFQAEFAQMLTLGPLVKGRVPSLFVHHQLHWIYSRRFMEASCRLDANAKYLTERMILEEKAYLNTFDSVIVFSEVDRQALKEFTPQLPVYVSPFPTPEEPLEAPLQFWKTVNQFVFVGSDSHPSNLDGLCWFIKEVWPNIKKEMPNAVFEVVGQWSPRVKETLCHASDIQFLGFVPDLASALHHKIMIVPIMVGSGIRTKILAAWGASCPVITTSVGVEGLPGVSGTHFLAMDDPGDFGKACVELAGDLQLLNRISTNALQLVKRSFSLEVVRRERMEIYNKLLARATS